MRRRAFVRSLRENVEALSEYMFDASAYPGPEPGKMWALSAENPSGALATATFRDLMARKEAEKNRQRKKKKADIRPQLRKMALWLQKREP